MKIESKYNIGQKVYVVIFDYDNYPSDGLWVVEERIVEEINISKNGICYKLNFESYECFEEMCFSNYTEARLVADKRNKGEE